jgi:DNA-binding transcriptional MerR regulator
VIDEIKARPTPLGELPGGERRLVTVTIHFFKTSSSFFSGLDGHPLLVLLLSKLKELVNSWRSQMAGKKQSDPFEMLLGPTFEIPAFSTGEVTEILEIPIWRLQKFLDVKSYPLSPAGQIGGRRVFSTADVCRIATANRLLRDGFAPKHVVKALQYIIEDEELLGAIDKRGDELPRGGICFKRGKKGPEIDFFRAGRAPKITVDGPEYYLLDLDRLLRDVDARIKAVLENRGSDIK